MWTKRKFTDSRPVKDQIISGLVITAKTLLAIFTGGALAGGLAVLRTPEAIRPVSFVGRHPITPWACVVVATLILIFTIDRWVTILPGILGYGILGGLIMLASGHYGKMHVPRPIALAFTLYTIAGTGLALSFARRPLTLIDRVALLAFVFCLALSMTPDNFAMTAALGIGVAFLLIAWVLDRIPRHYGHEGLQRSRHAADGR